MSAVRNRIASLEAASSKGGGFPSPTRPTSNDHHRSRNNTASQNEPNAVKQKQQAQGQKENPIQYYRRRSREPKSRSKLYRDKKVTNNADIKAKTSSGSERSDGQVASSDKDDAGEGPCLESSSSTTVTASENRKSRIRQSQQFRDTSTTPSTNLSEMRRQRRILQSQRRLKSVHKGASDNTKEEGEGDGTLSGTTSNRVPDSPGDFSNASNGGRFTKLTRLQRRPNGFNQRQSSAATNVTRASIETSLIQNTTTSAATAKPYSRRQNQESPKNSSPRSALSNYGGGADQQQLNSSLEAPTDDDATLTSVHRIMEGSNNKHSRIANDSSQNQNHSYETLQPNHKHNVKYENPSWKSSQGAGNRNTIWKEEHKSDKLGRVLKTEYSSDYDMDDVSKTDRSRQSTQFAEGPINSQAIEANDYFNNSRHHTATNGNMLQNNIGSNNNRRIDDDDRTFDYGDRDDDSNGGTSFVRRKREAEQRRARLVASNHNDMNTFPNSPSEQGIHQANGNNGEPMLLSKEDMEHLTMNDSPSLRLSAGVAAVATVGLCIGGPVGLLAGVAAGGLGFGFMQIPEEERKKIQAKAEKAVNSLHEKACDASEVLSSSCINTYQDSGVADHVPQCLPSNIADQLVPNCPTGGSVKSDGVYNTAGGTAKSAQITGIHTGNSNIPEHSSTIPAGPLMEQKAPSSMSHNERMRVKKVACLRNVRILPIAQIHGLEPSSQPRAWLDVVASANTTNEQKNEALEEVLLLAKDKRRAKIFLDEGILDFIIWTLSRYIEKVEVIGKTTDWAFPDITPNEKKAANLAAMCCVTLGKTHCASIHTEGDLLLMSMYERGTVPEERQVAQMLHEVPHHARVTKTNDPTIVQPSKEVFAPRQLSLSQAEELARSIKLVASGDM